jgi:uncharacterized protein GlcG (DUF336 family)
MRRVATLAVALVCATGAAQAQNNNAQNPNNGCGSLPSYSALQSALSTATHDEASGLNNQMWGTIVDRDGNVCAVAFTGVNRGAQWPGSRVISAQKANTANAFSLDSSSNSNGSGQPNGLALSTANLYSAVQPGGSLFGLQESNPVDTGVAYKGPASKYGTAQDPMVGNVIGGVNVFGGGLALYGPGKKIVGGVGVSGDTSCADHDIAWRVATTSVSTISGPPTQSTEFQAIRATRTTLSTTLPRASVSVVLVIRRASILATSRSYRQCSLRVTKSWASGTVECPHYPECCDAPL